jgi:hypothetical protein
MEAGAYQLAKDDALAAWQPKPRVQSRWLDTYVNYMVLGTHGFTYAELASRLGLDNRTYTFKLACNTP